MDIATGLMGLGLTVLGIILAYIWKSNGKIQTYMMSALERIEKGQEEGFKSITEGQEEGFKSITEGQERIAEMLLNQTKILERIEGKL